MAEKEIAFAVFCIESVASYLNINGSELYTKLTADSRILDDYIIGHYDTLHTQGKDYIVNDIVDYMKNEGLVK